jgi:CheY-like chemotaxis protein
MADLSESNRRVSTVLAERENLQGELLRSQKQSALGTLASGIAHDFNNILVPILMASEEARDESPPGSRQRGHLDSVIASATRARNLVRRILDFSRSPSVERRPTAIEPILLEVGALLRSSAPAGIDIHYRIEAAGAHVLADAGELHQILMNLGTNAYLAMKETGGTLTLAVHRPAPGKVQIDVSDSGAGIPRDLHDRIFDPFFTTRSPGSGTGLGLAIVHRLVTAMAGTVSFDSEPGRGTRFSLSFDEAEPDVPGAPVHDSDGQPEGPEAGARGRVLVVDDEELVRGLLAVILSRTGYQVREAASPESALRQVHDEPDGVDLVITDLAMPRMNGLQLAENLRTLRPELPILLTTGYLSDEDLAQVRAMSINGVLEKPFSRKSVMELVAEVLGDAGHPAG